MLKIMILSMENVFHRLLTAPNTIRITTVLLVLQLACLVRELVFLLSKFLIFSTVELSHNSDVDSVKVDSELMFRGGVNQACRDALSITKMELASSAKILSINFTKENVQLLDVLNMIKEDVKVVTHQLVLFFRTTDVRFQTVYIFQREDVLFVLMVWWQEVGDAADLKEKYA